MKTIKLLSIVNLEHNERVMNTQELFERFKGYINQNESNLVISINEQTIHFFETEEEWITVVFKNHQENTIYGRLYHGQKNNFFKNLSQKVSVFKDTDVEKVYNYHLLQNAIPQSLSKQTNRRIKI